MEVIATGKYIRISPKKSRAIADLVRGKDAKTSFNMLSLMAQKPAGVIAKVLGSAMANAENNFNLDRDSLVIEKIMIDGGPVLKRFQPRAKGMAYSIKKRTSHITVIVSGDVSTKKIAEKVSKEKESKADDHKIEVDRPEILKKEKSAPKVAVQNKMFRRKTG
jgi:large subunit ribosomal protein L22